MNGFWREYSPSVVASVALHGLLVLGILSAARISLHHPSPNLQPLPLTAVVVDARSLRPAEPAPAAATPVTPVPVAPSPPAPPAPPAPVPDPQIAARAAAEARAQAQAAEQQRQAARITAEALAAAQERKLAEAKREAEQQRERQAAAQREAEARKAQEAQKLADAKRVAEQRAKADREAELRRQLADEEHVRAVEASPLSDRYTASLVARMTRAWIKPPSAGPGIDCRVEVTQVPGGEVVGARVTQCNGDAAVRQSIENAVYRASPLPDPPDPALFHRVFIFEFKPDE